MPRNGYKNPGHRFLKPLVVGALSLAVLLEAFVLVGGVGFLRQHGGLASVLPGVVALLTNDARTDENLLPLRESEILARGAQMKADDMAKKGYFSHTGPEGEQPWVWFMRAGYRYQYAGENLAVNYDESEEVVDAWLKSPTHRANILKEQYTEIGIGIATGTYKGREATFVVQFFGKPAPAGVAHADGRSGSGVPATETLHSGEVLGTSTSMLEDFIAAPASSEKQTFLILLGALGILIAACVLFGRKLPKLVPTILILAALALVLGFALIHKEYLLGHTYVEGVER